MTDSKRIKESLLVNANDELVFISGTTQPTEVDNQFLEALLKSFLLENTQTYNYVWAYILALKIPMLIYKHYYKRAKNMRVCKTNLKS